MLSGHGVNVIYKTYNIRSARWVDNVLMQLLQP